MKKKSSVEQVVSLLNQAGNQPKIQIPEQRESPAEPEVATKAS